MPAAPGFSGGFTRGAAVASEATQLKLARNKQIQDQLKASLDASEQSAQKMFDEQIKLIGQSVSNGANAQQVEDLASHAIQPLQAHATLLQQLRAQATAAGASPAQIALLPDPDKFVQSRIGLLDSTVQTALQQTPEAKAQRAATEDVVKVTSVLKKLGVDASPQRIAEALKVVPATSQGTQQIREGSNYVTRSTVNGQPDMSPGGVLATSPIKEGAQTITMMPSPPQGMAYVPDEKSAVGYKLVRLPGAPAQSFTEGQNKSYMLATRMRELSGDVLNVAPGVSVQVMAKIAQSGGIAGAVANLGLSAEEQKHFNAARGWLAGVLRQDTGATIQPFEIQEYYPTFFPVPNDTDAQIEQKRRLREATENAMAANAGRPLSAPADAVSYLKEHPETAAQFKEKYGYLPE